MTKELIIKGMVEDYNDYIFNETVDLLEANDHISRILDWNNPNPEHIKLIEEVKKSVIKGLYESLNKE